ncbi:MAG: SRPBCC family protein [Brachybacterium sp.]|nr:SRPBCC family protein [Brachybacterium sp.]
MNTEQKSLTVTRTIDSSPKEIFEVLSLPSRHPQIDGSGFIRSDDHNDRIEKSGTKFTMNMEGDHMGGEYRTDNWVSAFDENKMIGWKTAPEGTEPPGWEWLWQLEAEGSDATRVSLTYDWSAVTDKELLKKVSFPLVTEEQLEESLNNLAAAVAGN